MKLIISLIILTFSSLSFSDGIYVRKTVADSGISAADGEKVRDVLRKAVTDQGHKLVSTPGQAQWSIRAFVSKAATGPYIVKVERVHAGKLVGTNHGSDLKLDEATRLATTNLVEALGKILPEKTSVSNSEVAPAPAVSSDSYEHREVAANVLSSEAAMVEAKHPNYIKNFIISLGPVISNNLVGSNGTKFGVMFAYTAGLSEHFNILYFYDSNFNTASVGGTSTGDFGVGVKYYFADRLSDSSLWVSLDGNYGGGNRANDSSFGGGGALGLDLFRTQASTFAIYARELVFSTSNGSTLANLPNITQVMIGINF